MTNHDFTPDSPLDVRSLPEFSPPPALRERILAAHAQQRRRQQRRGWLGGGALAASFALVGLLALRQTPAPVLAPLSAQQQSHALEHDWQRTFGSRSAHVSTPRLRAIDAELQAAYDRGATADELSSLWARRNLALRQLIDTARQGTAADQGHALTRI